MTAILDAPVEQPEILVQLHPTTLERLRGVQQQINALSERSRYTLATALEAMGYSGSVKTLNLETGEVTIIPAVEDDDGD